MDSYIWIIILLAGLFAFKIYVDFFFNVGAYGEKLSVKKLQQLNDPYAKILSNVYLQKNAAGETTEIDVLMIRSSGIYVLESKNYSGWIFGSTRDHKWTQTLPGKGKRRKNSFLNPIHQNNLHIRCLIEHLARYQCLNIPIYSIIVFSDRCTFKNVNVQDSNVPVIKRKNLRNIMQQIHNTQNIAYLTPEQIEVIYQILLPCTNVSNEVKMKHIQDIKNSHTGK